MTARGSARCTAGGDSHGEEGSASLEFLSAGVLLLVPLVYLVVLVSSLQAASLGVEGAARQSARLFVRAETPAAGQDVAERAILASLDDYGIDPSTTVVDIRCDPHPADCLERGGTVTVTVDATVPLPLLPPFLEVEAPLGVAVEGTSTQPVSRFREGG